MDEGLGVSSGQARPPALPEARSPAPHLLLVHGIALLVVGQLT